jgi:hypothetical protein
MAGNGKGVWVAMPWSRRSSACGIGSGPDGADPLAAPFSGNRLETVAYRLRTHDVNYPESCAGSGGDSGNDLTTPVSPIESNM